MKKATLLKNVILASNLFLFGAFFISCTKKSEQYNEKPVIKVNQEVLTAASFAEQISGILRQYDALSAKNPDFVLRAKQQVQDNFIKEAIIQSYAKETGIAVTDKDIEDEFNSARATYPNDLAFRKSLADEGVSPEQWKSRTRKTLLEKKVLDSFSAKVKKPSSEEIKSYFQEHKSSFSHKERFKLRQIVLPKQLDAERVLAELKKTGDFAGLAKKYSIGPEGIKGGQLGWVEKGTLEVFDQAAKMGRGARNIVITSPYGYHIIEVLEKRGAESHTLERARDQIVKILAEKQLQQFYNSWFEGRLKKTKVFFDKALIDSMEISTK